MKLVCKYGNLADEGSLWCRNCDHDCPPNKLSLVFDPGEHMDELEILERIQVLPTSVLYRARRVKETVLVKIAHKDCEDRLKQEARFLSEAAPHPALPTLLSASLQERRPYNKCTVRGEMKYYTVYKNFAGHSLRELFKNDVQPPPQFAAWLIVGLADAIAFLHVKYNTLVQTVAPEGVLVRVDKSGVPRPLLVDLGAMCKVQSVATEYPGSPAYQAPEMLQRGVCQATTDVYALGLLMYEMLAGQPAFPTRMRKEKEIAASVVATPPVSLSQRRPDLNRSVADLINQSLSKQPTQRQPDIRTFAKGLRLLFGEVPPEPKGFRPGRRLIAILVLISIIILLFTILILFM